MKKALMMTLLLVFSLTFAFSSQLRYLSVNHGKVYIGKRALKKGDKFDSKSTLRWEDDDQIMEVINQETRRKEYIAVQTLVAAKTNTAHVIISREILAARFGIPLTAQDMERYFNRQLILLSSICVETGFILDDDHCFFLQYVHDGDTINKRLPATDEHTFCIDDRIFVVDGQPLSPATLQARLYYFDRPSAVTTLMADSLVLNVEPRQSCRRLLQTCRESRLDAQETETVITDYCRVVFPQAATIDDDISRFCQ